MRVALLIVLLAGCDQLFKLDPIERIDAASGDAPFDLADCPPSYIELWYPGSRYRISRGGTAWLHHDTCAGDAPGLTHLAVIETSEEHVALEARRAAVEQIWYVGTVQRRTALTTDQHWLWLTNDAPVLIWHTDEPNDVDESESDHWEQFAVMHSTAFGLIDYDGAVVFDALCECDGRAITALARDTVDSNRK